MTSDATDVPDHLVRAAQAGDRDAVERPLVSRVVTLFTVGGAGQ